MFPSFFAFGDGWAWKVSKVIDPHHGGLELVGHLQGEGRVSVGKATPSWAPHLSPSQQHDLTAPCDGSRGWQSLMGLHSTRHRTPPPLQWGHHRGLLSHLMDNLEGCTFYSRTLSTST